MRKLVLETQISVDGFIADTDSTTDAWVWPWAEEWTWDPALQRYHNALHADADCILLAGHDGHRDFIRYWTDRAEQTDNPQAGFARDILRARKLVYTRRPEGVDGENVEPIVGDLTTAVHELKASTGGLILVYGGGTLVSTLLRADLIDELHLLVNPCALGAGMPIFAEVAERPYALTLIESTGHGCGVVLTKYARHPRDVNA